MTDTVAVGGATGETGERLAWGWVAHLRDGGTTTWREWRAAATGTAPSRGRYLPGAQQLELLRRLNAERPTGRPQARLVERVLGASAPGRGIPDLELVGADSRSPFGPPPVEPSDLPAAELTRLASGLVAEDLVAGAGSSPAFRAPVPRPWRKKYRLVGDPWLADPVRAELVRRGRPPGGAGSVVLVLGRDLATMLADAWTTGAFGDGAAPWRDWLDPLVRRQRVPPRVDLVRTARTWRAKVGRERVEVVLDPAALPGLVGVRRALPARPTYSADAVDLARRVGSALGLMVLPDRRTHLLHHALGPRLAAAPGAPLALPEAHVERVRRRAARMRDALLADGYAVHGDPEALVPQAPPAGADPDDHGVLTLALRLLLDDGPASRAREAQEGVR